MRAQGPHIVILLPKSPSQIQSLAFSMRERRATPQSIRCLKAAGAIQRAIAFASSGEKPRWPCAVVSLGLVSWRAAAAAVFIPSFRSFNRFEVDDMVRFVMSAPSGSCSADAREGGDTKQGLPKGKNAMDRQSSIRALTPSLVMLHIFCRRFAESGPPISPTHNS
jgi:hypothetical protein